MYVVKCSDNTLYAGYTTNILRRLEVHNAKKVQSTQNLGYRLY
ncbi:GIY-YIG nuclease family protein [Gemella bergeri]